MDRVYSMCRRAILRAAFFVLPVMIAGQCGNYASGAELFFQQGVGGEVGIHVIKADESLIELARHYDVGFNEIEAANPEVDPYLPVVGTAITIPGKWILPEVPKKKGIVVNVAEMRLYYFPQRSKEKILTFPVGIGDEGWETPPGKYRIIEKIVNPAWYVPASIREQKPELPRIVPPGPDNPLGTHALRLSNDTVLIHGTNRPFGIGRRVSHGCIRLYPEDIVALFRQVKQLTTVTIVRQPIKAVQVNGRVLVEIHGAEGEDLQLEAVNLLKRKDLLAKIDQIRLAEAIRIKSGIPTDITGKE